MQRIQCKSKRKNQIKFNQHQEIRSGTPTTVFVDDEWNQFSIVYQIPNRVWFQVGDITQCCRPPNRASKGKVKTRSPVNSPHKGQWRGALMFSLICARINGWVNNGEAGDSRRYLAHYDVIVMKGEWDGWMCDLEIQIMIRMRLKRTRN